MSDRDALFRMQQALKDVARMACPGRGYTMQMIRRRALGGLMAERFCRCPRASDPSPCDSWAMGGICEFEDTTRPNQED